MKTSRTKRQARKQSAQPRAVLHKRLVERRIDGRRFIEFPSVKGRTLEKVELFTIPEHHSITLYFQDETFLTLVIEPGFLIDAHMSDLSTGDERVLRRWPTIKSTTQR